MKRFLTSVINACRPALLKFLRIWFDGQYLRGQHFDCSFTGLKWCVRSLWQRNILRLARPQRAPMSLSCKVSSLANLDIHADDLHNLQTPNLYIQNYWGRVSLGKGVFIGPNVGFITANHSPHDLTTHMPAKPIVLGERCWIGMNSVVLPGVRLGPETIVGAGSVVTNSFEDGRCVIAGNPARLIRVLK
jgi:hypothetical protein